MNGVEKVCIQILRRNSNWFPIFGAGVITEIGEGVDFSYLSRRSDLNSRVELGSNQRCKVLPLRFWDASATVPCRICNCFPFGSHSMRNHGAAFYLWGGGSSLYHGLVWTAYRALTYQGEIRERGEPFVTGLRGEAQFVRAIWNGTGAMWYISSRQSQKIKKD